MPGSVEGIREASEWVGLDYDYGDHAFICTGGSCKRRTAPSLFPGTFSRT